MRSVILLGLAVILAACGGSSTSSSSTAVIDPNALKPGAMRFGSALSPAGVASPESSFAMSDSLFYVAHLTQHVTEGDSLVLLLTGPQGYENQVKIRVTQSGSTLVADGPVSVSDQLGVAGTWTATLFMRSVSGSKLAEGTFTVRP